MKVYYRDETEKERISQQHPDLKIDFIPLPEESRKIYDDVLVCRDDDPLEACFIGEAWIQKLADLDQKKVEEMR